MHCIQFSCLILSIVACNVDGLFNLISNPDECRRFCCPHPYSYADDGCFCNVQEQVSDEMCACTNEELANCDTTCNPPTVHPGVVPLYKAECVVIKREPNCRCPRINPESCNDLDCHTSCCPKWGACDPDKGNTCQCVDGMDRWPSVAQFCQKGVTCYDDECQRSCCPKWGACDPEAGNTCQCEDATDHWPQVEPNCPKTCQDYDCQKSCCPRWGACDQTTGVCQCKDGTEDLQEVQAQCAAGGKSCNSAEIDICQQQCQLPPGETAGCIRGPDGEAVCDCQPNQGQAPASGSLIEGPCNEDEVKGCNRECLEKSDGWGNAYAYVNCERAFDGSAQCNCQAYQG